MVYPIKKDMPFYVTLTVLGLCRYYPLNHQSKVRFYLIFCIWAIIWNASFTLGPMLMFIIDIINLDYVAMITTFPVTTATTVISTTIIIFAIKHEMWSELFERTADCNKFGKSKNFDHLKQQGRTFVPLYFMCIVSGLSVVAIYEIFHENTCLNSSEKNEVCGLMFPFWLPSGLQDSIVIKRLLLVYQLFIIITNSAFTQIVTLQSEIRSFIEDKSEHLSRMFRQIDPFEAPKVQYRKFVHCMEYHHYILNLCEELDRTSKETCGYITFPTSAVTAFFLYHGIRGYYKFIFYSCIYFLSIWFMCNTGQELEGAISRIGDSLYLSNWYDYCIEIQKMIPYVIQRSQRSVALRAVPIGRLNYSFLTAIVKTTYSYLSLLSSTT